MVRQDPPSQARAAANDFVDRVADAGMRAADQVGRMAAHVEDTRDELLAQGAQISANVQKVGKNFSKALDKSISDQPMTTLGLAVVTGFVLGALWKA
ncbi:hypothetical protein [Hyphomicrobium sp.]|jgi:ElaB/YqjD/DUF883 family membrane-anchored ribosome-binding protein|uniref:hypothetical protein n=1 Tax=Hyphomicrobium sp. TaxID=82 RepID=UPI002B508C82|nr:hypothetical protein [Hyphomicrobium sp.]HVZ04020.1 hypothetical protein [Hyphomicrobium sp.]